MFFFVLSPSFCFCLFCYFFFFFFKQKTAYEMLRSLVGSEMCIRDRIEYLATDIHYSSHVVSNVFDALDMPSGSALMTPSMLRSVAARCRVKSAPKAKPTPAASSATKKDGSKSVSYTHLTLPTKRIV
eukprot:TRINITY_DN15201_c0_g1_i1.p1 TRINITY_DN15201_c0_g1~~TRINITY_DN15201_c0_g1_i1.p1  ORF type:complete len:128 (+),score=49.39 TRINITY_DN15201_c0_g1_i1:44-427(+)